ncbi:unnamed protein product [Mycena citricolor]|uniref:SET domain-containing protein n=1 Tax=Mycena citricolor TaxID=2018698 RepID=A0AAD2K001_9AGAR|nr:unnamed protein product [Mycena citricolor]CAK5270248.1 unnamed protein product [Mycena citricolor]
MAASFHAANASVHPIAYHPLCVVKDSPGKGRGLFAARSIPPRTLLESSPVLLFGKEEYENHGKHTLLDHYTFKWRNGSMALALGLGSLFNHSESPNVSYTLDPATESIHYTSTRNISEGDELCIYYGSNLWFDATGSDQSHHQSPEPEDGWGGLLKLDLSAAEDADELEWHVPDGDESEVLPEEMLPFQRIKPLPEGETADTVRTIEAWAVDVPEERNLGPLLKWLKQSQLDLEALSHLRRIRKQDNTCTFLLSIVEAGLPYPSLPKDIVLPVPYHVTVPASAALTTTSLALKMQLWPTVFSPVRKNQEEDWTRGKARWAWTAMRKAIAEAKNQSDELPITAHVPVPYETESDDIGPFPTAGFLAHDRRHSTNHPLRHAVMNVIRAIGEYHASGQHKDASARSGYLLSNLTLFTTHEPCVMCTMALTHSRVKEVIYLVPMTRTGGCGGSVCVPLLPGINHRFWVAHWKRDAEQVKGIKLDDNVDA